uniref:Uncharacterized protein n=1 Tax=Capra hircus TaxID=9925 RepID=A0A8C2R2M4_CAPHI
LQTSLVLFYGLFLPSGKTILANFLTEASDITEYNQTQGFESYWPDPLKGSNGVVIIFNDSILSHLKETEMWYSCFVQQQLVQNALCLLITHHKPGSRSDKENPALAPPLNRLKLVHSNLEDDPEEIRMEFIKHLRSIINTVSESRDSEKMKVMTNLESILKSRDINLPKNGPSRQGCAFSSSHVWM